MFWMPVVIGTVAIICAGLGFMAGVTTGASWQNEEHEQVLQKWKDYVDRLKKDAAHYGFGKYKLDETTGQIEFYWLPKVQDETDKGAERGSAQDVS